jgi:anti-sigma-K factor RskA
MDDGHVLDLLPAHALGALEAGEASGVDEHLAACLICRAEAGTFEVVAGELSAAAPAAAPSPDLKDRLMQRAAGSRTPAAATEPTGWRPALTNLLPVWGALSLALIVTLAALSLSLWQRLDRLESLAAPGGMRAFALTGSEAAPEATGFVLVGADGRNGALVVDRLAPLGEDRQYQVWLIRDGQRTSGGVFSTDAEGYRGLRIESAESLFAYSAVSVSIEPAGGSPQPTGPRVLGGPLLHP